MRTVVLVVGLAVGGAPLLVAQAPAAASANPISAAMQSGWGTIRNYIRQSAELMPEANYAFGPVDTVRTFGQILAHVAGANYEFCAAAKGEKSPHGEGDFEKTATTRAQIVKALNDSLAYCETAYSSLNDRRAGEAIEMPFGMGKGVRATALMMNIGHLNEHYGNLVTYFRIKGIVPPSSRPQ
jgi:uncharacterized damage-inducible protein DinB